MCVYCLDSKETNHAYHDSTLDPRPWQSGADAWAEAVAVIVVFFAQSKLQPTLQWQHFWSSLTVLLQGRAWENQEIQGHQNGAPLQGQSKQAKSCGSLSIQNLTHYILFSESNWRFTVSWSCCRICWISIIFLVVYFFLTIFGP